MHYKASSHSLDPLEKQQELIDNYQIDGDFIESQGMALLGIRYMLKKQSTYYETTKVLKNIYLGEKC